MKIYEVEIDVTVDCDILLSQQNTERKNRDEIIISIEQVDCLIDCLKQVQSQAIQEQAEGQK